MAAEAAAQSVQTKQATKEAKSEAKAEAKPEAGKEAEAKQGEVTEVKLVDPKARQDKADAIIHRNVLWALGAGVVPVPLFDAVAITGIQIKMLKELSDLYELKFTSHIVKKSIGALASGLGSVGIGGLIGGSLAKLIPAIGTTVGVISVPLVAAAFTRATGKIFLMHFESGGTLLDFDPNLMREYFRQEFEKAKLIVAQIQKGEQAPAADKPAS